MQWLTSYFWNTQRVIHSWDKYNIMCCANDITLSAPSRIGWQSLIWHWNLVFVIKGWRSIVINVRKFITIIEWKRLPDSSGKVNMFGCLIGQESEWKCVEDIMSKDLTLNADIERMSKALVKLFHISFIKFSYQSGDMLSYTFRTYRSSF